MTNCRVRFYLDGRDIVHDGDVGYVGVVGHVTALRTSHAFHVAALVIQTALTESVATANE